MLQVSVLSFQLVMVDHLQFRPPVETACCHVYLSRNGNNLPGYHDCPSERKMLLLQMLGTCLSRLLQQSHGVCNALCSSVQPLKPTTTKIRKTEMSLHHPFVLINEGCHINRFSLPLSFIHPETNSSIHIDLELSTSSNWKSPRASVGSKPMESR